MVEINHLAFATNAADKASEIALLTALKTMFNFLSGVYVYVVAWALFGQDNGDKLGPDNLTDFTYLSSIITGTGVLFANIFYIGTKEVKNRRRKSSTFMDLGHGGVLFMGMFGRKPSSLASSIVHMLVTSWDENTDQQQEKQDTLDHETNRQRKRSLLRKFVDVIFFDDEEEIDHGPSQSEIEKPTQGDPQNGDTKTQMVLGFKEDQQREDTTKQMVLELQKLDRDRKKSLLVHVFNGLLSRSDHSQQEQMSNENIDDHVAVDITNQENYWGEEGLQDIQRDENQEHNNEADSVDREIEIDQEDKPTSVSAMCKQRKSGIVMVASEGQLGLSNFGFDHEEREEIGEEFSSDTSGPRDQKKSVTFSLSKFPVLPSINEDGEKHCKLDTSDDKLPIVANRGQEKDKESASVEDGGNPSEFKQEVLDLPLSSQIHPAKKRRPKRMKDWLREPNLYKVAIVYTCSRLLQGTVYTYLQLFLTERLLFGKEAIAYFPLVLLISAALSSSLCEKLNKKIGSKWSYLLAASLVICGAVWSYFLNPSTRQVTYAPVILIGFGMSVMYVMSLTFITDLIGENKETSGAVISIITVVARLASGGLVIGIQEFYPDQDIDTNEAISDYVQHVFVMVPGILTLVGFLLVFIFQSSVLACRTNAPDEDIKAEELEDRSPSKHAAASTVSQTSVNQNTTMASCPEDTKL